MLMHFRCFVMNETRTFFERLVFDFDSISHNVGDVRQTEIVHFSPRRWIGVRNLQAQNQIIHKETNK